MRRQYAMARRQRYECDAYLPLSRCSLAVRPVASLARRPTLASPTRRCAATPRPCGRCCASGADVNAAQGDGMTALHWTALNGDLKTMNVLLLAGATTEPLTRVGAYTPLHLASSRGHAAVVARLLEAGSKPRRVDGDRRAAAASGGAGRQRAMRSRRCSIAAPTSTRATRRTDGRRSSSRPRRIGSRR